MQFFTPQLLGRFNSNDNHVADKADEQWDAALASYREHLRQIRGRLPRDVKELADLCLHDAELLSPEQTLEPVLSIRVQSAGPGTLWRAISVLPLKQENELITVIYVLSDRIRQRRPPRNWRFSKARPHWLYDEIDVDGSQRGSFLHRVLLSDGRTLLIPFISAVVRRVPLVSASGQHMARKGA